MGNSFFNESKKIANDFLQSIVFVDDRAYLGQNTNSSITVRRHDFDALKVTQAFARTNKLCVVYKPESLSDINNIIEISKKADVTVLDWQIVINKKITPEESEQDAEMDDPRGEHTCKIIRDLLSDSLKGSKSLKLIIIYTGEPDLELVLDTIYTSIIDIVADIDRAGTSISSENIKIVAISKPAHKEEDNSTDDSSNAKSEKGPSVAYEDLPDFILNEFSKLTTGLLSDFVLNSLTILRNNSFRLIQLYNKALDPAFFSHRVLLPNQEDSKEHLVEMLIHSLQALLNYNNAAESASSDRLGYWIDNYSPGGFEDSVTLSGKKINLDRGLLKQMTSMGLEESLKKYCENNGLSIPIKVDDFIKKVFPKGSSYLLPKDYDATDIDCKFSILTHHKSNLRQPSSKPKLTLGTLIKKMPVDDETTKYYLCIQAKCDSVRLKSVRNFLFIPFEVAESDKFQLVIEESGRFVKLKVNKNAFDLEIIKFDPMNEGIIVADFDDHNFVFKSLSGETYIWLCDLKDLHAQRFVNNYANQLSRVGLDESEWLRRSS